MERIKKFLEKHRFWILFLTGFGIFIDIFFFGQTWNLMILFLTALWILSVWLSRLRGRVSVAGGSVFLFLCLFFSKVKKDLIAEKAAIWAYTFLIVGVMQMFIEFLKEERENVKKQKK